MLGTEAGLIPLYASLPLGMKVERRDYAKAISGTLLDLINDQKTYYGWQIQHIPSRAWLMIHCPNGNQMLYHTDQHAWTNLTGYGATSWCESEVGIFFSKDNSI